MLIRPQFFLFAEYFWHVFDINSKPTSNPARKMYTKIIGSNNKVDLYCIQCSKSYEQVLILCIATLKMEYLIKANATELSDTVYVYCR